MNNKYHNRKVATSDGFVHDSRREAIRWEQLKLMEKAGTIRNLKRQVEFVLIPTQREETNEVYQRGEKKGLPKEGKVVEQQVLYIADFVYIDNETGEMVVEDTKGFKTKEYIIKRKLLLFVYGIRIREV